MSASGRIWSLIPGNWELQSIGDKVIEPVLCMTGGQGCAGAPSSPCTPTPCPSHGTCVLIRLSPATWPISQGHWQEGVGTAGLRPDVTGREPEPRLQLSLAGAGQAGVGGGGCEQQGDRKPQEHSCSFRALSCHHSPVKSGGWREGSGHVRGAQGGSQERQAGAGVWTTTRGGQEGALSRSAGAEGCFCLGKHLQTHR